MDPTSLQAAAEWLLDCACAALEDSPCGCPDWLAVVAGTPSFDACCDTGQLYVVATSLFPAGESFPFPADGPVRCGAGLTSLFTVGIVRCAPTMNDRGDPPTCAVQAESAAQVYSDGMAVMTGLLCCLYEARQTLTGMVTAQRYVGPSGGCVGSETTVALSLGGQIPQGS